MPATADRQGCGFSPHLPPASATSTSCMPADATESTIAIGTLEYSAPEVLANAAEVDWRSAEVWTLGVILLELISPVWCTLMDTVKVDPKAKMLLHESLQRICEKWVSAACRRCRVSCLHSAETAYLQEMGERCLPKLQSVVLALGRNSLVDECTTDKFRCRLAMCMSADIAWRFVECRGTVRTTRTCWCGLVWHMLLICHLAALRIQHVYSIAWQTYVRM